MGQRRHYLLGGIMQKKGLLARTPMQSKKFIAAMTWNLLWLMLIFYGIQSNLDVSTLNAMVYVTGGSQLGYLGGQSLVDSWVKGKIAQNGNENAA